MNPKSRLAFLVPIALSAGLMACSKVEYDFKALGFTDKTEMEAAFAKGYHTKQKLDEMVPKVSTQDGSLPTTEVTVVGLPTFKTNENYSSIRVKMIAANWTPFHSTNADECSEGNLRCKDRPEMEACAGTGMANCLFIWKKEGKTAIITTIGEDTVLDHAEIRSAPEIAASATANQAAEVAKVDPPKESPKSEDTKTADMSCTTVKTCADAMLFSARTENIGQAIELIKKIDAMPKPNRGDRKEARRLNMEGLYQFKQKNFDEAIKTFKKAHDIDPLDEEIAGSIAFAHAEAKQYSLSEQASYEALLVNPRRSNYWATLAVAKQMQGKTNEALQAMWLTWQFSQSKEKLIEFFDKRIAEEENEKIKALFVNAKTWVVDGKKPSF